MNLRRSLRALALVFVLAIVVQPLAAQLTLVETGGTFRGDATNVAAASAGGVAIFSSELSAFGHYGVEVNDGIYGNASSWIGGVEAAGWQDAWVGVIFAAPTTISSFAFGRDNTDVEVTRATWAGYYVQYTTAAVTAENAPSVEWTTLLLLDYYFSPPPDAHLRHLYNVNSPLTGVTAFRFLTSSGLEHGNAIDEIEVYATAAIPEPSTYAAAFAVLALACVLARHRASRHTRLA